MFVFVGVVAGHGMFVFIGVIAMECLGKVKYGLFDKLQGFRSPKHFCRQPWPRAPAPWQGRRGKV
jgi:hypothetical protein